MRNLHVALIAIVAGFFGSAIYDAVRAVFGTGVIRATEYQLVSSSGKVAARWHQDAPGDAVLTFSNGADGDLLAIGTDKGSPFLTLYADDGAMRAGLYLGPNGSPTLVLSERETEGRMLLGAIPGDVTTARTKLWGMSVRDHSGEPMASLLVAPDSNEAAGRGSLYLRNGKRIVLLPEGR